MFQTFFIALPTDYTGHNHIKNDLVHLHRPDSTNPAFGLKSSTEPREPFSETGFASAGRKKIAKFIVIDNCILMTQ